MTEKRDGKWVGNLRPDMPLADAARHVLLVRLQMVGAHLSRAVHGGDDDPEHVHQLRVATRRAGAALRIFRTCLPGKVYKRGRKRLRRLRRAAGEVRDWDVILLDLQSLRPQNASAEEPGHAFLGGYAFGLRTAAKADLDDVGRPAIRSYDQFLGETVAAVFASKKGTANPAGRLQALAQPLLAGLLHNLDEALDGDLDDFSHLHQVRIAGKRLRYAMEIFVDCYEAAFREVLYPLVEEVQEMLGAVNDSRVARDFLEALRDTVQAGALVDWSHVGPGVESMLSWHHERLAREKERFHAWLKQWRESNPADILQATVTGLPAP